MKNYLGLYITKSWRRLQNVYFRFRMAQREVPIVRAKSAFKLAQLTRPVGLLECRSKRLSEMQHSHNQNVLLHAPSVKSPRRPRQHVWSDICPPRHLPLPPITVIADTTPSFVLADVRDGDLRGTCVCGGGKFPARVTHSKWVSKKVSLLNRLAAV